MAKHPSPPIGRSNSSPDPAHRSGIGEAANWTVCFASAVREHLVSDVPLGVWSSGGLDSSTILHYAAEAAPARLKTFSISFHGREFDESEYFREIASKYQTDHHEFDLNAEMGISGGDARSWRIIRTIPAPTPARFRSGFFRGCAARK